MMLKRLPRKWDAEKALKGETKCHFFSAREFLTSTYGESIVEEITEAWKRTSPVELEVYRTDAACRCRKKGCEACETDHVCNDNTIIDIPEWDNGEGLILSPCWYATHAGAPDDGEPGISAYDKANMEFLALAHFNWPIVFQYIQRSYEAIQEALDRLYDERDGLHDPDPALDALIEKLENAVGE
jgi:hypothetical protein